jgi:hypothetical protein
LDRWESQGLFKPNANHEDEPFVVSMPPPNVTGALHMGHAMFVTLEVSAVFHLLFMQYISLLQFFLFCFLTLLLIIEENA